jgi:hypothetical protein
MRAFLLFIPFLFSTVLRAQDTIPAGIKDSMIVNAKPFKWDTAKYQKFDYVFIVGVFSQNRDFNNEIIQHINTDTTNNSKHTYVAESNVVTGFTFNYDKFQLSVSTRGKPRADNQGKGYTKMFNLGFNFGDNRFVSETYYRRFTGFYNKNTLDTAKNTQARYYLQPGMSSSLFMSRLLHFLNHEKFSYKSGFGCNYRQLKSAGTIVVGGNYSAYTLLNDSSIFPMKARHLFNDYANMKGMRSFNIGLTGGLAGTLVIYRAWFASAYFTLGPEVQWRDYNLTTHHRKICYISFSGIGRFAMGLNLKKFYMLYSLTNDYNLYNSFKIMDFKSESVTNNFTFGWRFHTGLPKWYAKFQETKIYKLF